MCRFIAYEKINEVYAFCSIGSSNKLFFPLFFVIFLAIKFKIRKKKSYAVSKTYHKTYANFDVNVTKTSLGRFSKILFHPVFVPLKGSLYTSSSGHLTQLDFSLSLKLPRRYFNFVSDHNHVQLQLAF